MTKKFIAINIPRIAFSNVDYLELDHPARGDHFVNHIRTAMFKYLDYEVKANGQIILKCNTNAIATENAKAVITSYETLADAQANIKVKAVERYKCAGNDCVNYHLLVEYDNETKQVPAFYDPYFAKDSDGNFYRVNMANLVLKSNQKIDNEEKTKILYKSIVFGFFGEIAASHAYLIRPKDREINLNRVICLRQPTYKIVKLEARAVAQEQAMRFFQQKLTKNVANLIVPHVPATPELVTAQQIRTQKEAALVPKINCRIM